MRERKPSANEVRFFNVSLINASVMSTPRFPQSQQLIGELIRSIEAASPRFAWVQFLFKRVNLSAALVALKNSMNFAVQEIKTPRTSLIQGGEFDRPELYRDWYKKFGERIKKIDAITNRPHVLLAIQGMWVGSPASLQSLPFRDCSDELDRLGLFVYRNPWMLAELVERRMVEDISSYVTGYTSSRLEPPSFLVTQEEIPYLIHLPVVKEMRLLRSVAWKQHSPEVREGKVEGGRSSPMAARSKVVRLAKIPWIGEPLKEAEAGRLSLMPSSGVRSFELLYNGIRTDIALSSESERDAAEYIRSMESIYGELEALPVSQKPEFLTELPVLMGFAITSQSENMRVKCL